MFALTLRGCFGPLFQKWAPCAQQRPPRRRKIAVSFVSFSLCLLQQRKAAKESWYLKIVPLTLITAYLLSLFLLKQEAQKKKLCKKKMPFFAYAAGAAARRAPTFEKVGQNNRAKSVQTARQIKICNQKYLYKTIQTFHISKGKTK